MGFEAFVKGASDLFDQDTGGSPVNPPLTKTVSSHSISIRTNKGLKIGRIQSWAPQMSRVIDTIYEVHVKNKGEPRERVPQIQNSNSISIDRYEMYTFHMGEAFGTPITGDGIDLINLTMQAKPFHVREIWRDPFGGLRAYGYFGCWFSNLGLTISAVDDRIVKARATLEFTRRIKLS